MFLVVILGTTHKRAPVGFAGLAIGLGLTLIHLISIPVTNTSVNPARSTATAVFVGGWALQQLWLFWLAPLLGAALGGLTSQDGSRRRRRTSGDRTRPSRVDQRREPESATGPVREHGRESLAARRSEHELEMRRPSRIRRRAHRCSTGSPRSCRPSGHGSSRSCSSRWCRRS